jgi:hypothetical protein
MLSTRSSTGQGKKGSGAEAPQTLIGRRAVETSYTAAKASATIGMSGAAIIADSLINMSEITSSTNANSTDKVDLLGTGGTDLFGVGSNLDLFV